MPESCFTLQNIYVPPSSNCISDSRRRVSSELWLRQAVAIQVQTSVQLEFYLDGLSPQLVVDCLFN